MPEIQIKCGKPRVFSYKEVKYLSITAIVFNIIILLYSLEVIFESIKIKVNIGDYINLVTDNDGDTLPFLLFILGLLTLPISIFFLYLLYKLYSKKPRPTINKLTFVLILTILGTILIIFIESIMILLHLYSSHESLHNGIAESMKNYSSDSLTKFEIDTLQLKFECCGSQKYTEWYEIVWYDKNLMSPQEKISKASTPFSCCSKSSRFHCIHHAIDKEGSIYRYRPNDNLSINTLGCMDKIIDVKRTVGWNVIGHCVIMQIFLAIIAVCARFIQTAHYNHLFFDKKHEKYTCWLFGCFMKKKEDPPPIPPFPSELMD